jgi:hypothetical protein
MAITLSSLLLLAISFDENESDFYQPLYAILRALPSENGKGIGHLRSLIQWQNDRSE